MRLIELIRDYPIRALVVGGALLYIISGLMWWNLVYMNPQRAFDDMLANNLSARSVTKNITLEASGEQLAQTVRLQLGTTNAAFWLVTAKYDGNTVTTESIGTPQTDYVRYTQIASNNEEAINQYKPALNQWAKSAAPTETAGGLFQQALLDINYAPVPPIGYVMPEQRAQMLEFMREQSIFQPDYETVRTVTVGDRKAFEYTVSVAQAPYVRLMQSFEKSFGYNTLSDVSATQYQGQPPDKIVMVVDKLSHQLVRLSYERTGYTETFSGYGIVHSIQIPARTIPLDTLRQRLSG